MTQDYLAACLELTQSSYGRLEKDDNRLTIPKLLKIAEILEVKIGQLVGEVSEKSIHQTSNQTANAYNTESVIYADPDHINSLKEEILFLRNLLDKNSNLTCFLNTLRFFNTS